MMKRVLRSLGQLGFQQVVFYQSFLCEKSYRQSSLYTPEAASAYLQEGVEQVGHQVIPKVLFFDSFRIFLEDFLLVDFQAGHVCITDPDAPAAPPHRLELPQALVFGPERGFSDQEVQLLQSLKLHMESHGKDHLRLETAVPYIIGSLHASLVEG